MRKAGHYKKGRRTILTLLIVSLFIVSLPQIYSNNLVGMVGSGSSDQSASISSTLSPAGDPAGPPRPVNESAVGVDRGAGSGWSTNLPSAGTSDLPVTLKFQWSGSKLYTTVAGLWDQRDWVSNGNFTSSSSGWSFSSLNVGTVNTFSSSWTSGYVTARINGYDAGGGQWGYNNGDRMSWNQTLNVPRGTIISAKIEFKYYISAGAHNLDAEIYAWVGNARVNGIAYVNIPDPLGSWHSVSWDVPLSQISTPSILVSVGHKHLVSMTYGGIGTYAEVRFDEVRLTVKALVKPEQINLKLAAPGFPNVNCSINSPSPSTYGVGDGTLTGFVIGPAPSTQTTYSFDFTSNVTSPATGYLLANATIYVSRSSTVQAFFDNLGDKVKWQLSIVTQFAMYDEAVSTTHYTNYYFNTSAPANWVYTTCADPGGTNHAIPSANLSNFTVGSTQILRVDVTGIGQYSSGSNGYAPYRINAESDNYVREVFTQKYTGGSWQNATTFRPNDYMRVVGFIASPSGVRANSGTANMSSWYGTPATTWKPLNQTTPSNGFANFTFVVTNSIAFASNYTVEVAWLNQTSDQPQAGVGTEDFQITRPTQIRDYTPEQLQRIAQSEYFTISVDVVDQIDQTPLQGALAQYKVDWKAQQTLLWNSLGQNYTSSPQEQMPSAAHGLKWVNITVSKAYYDSLSVNISVYAILATQAAPQTEYKTIYWGTNWYNYSISFYGVNPPNNTAISGATISCQTPFWQNRTFSIESVAGSYDVSIYTAGVSEETYWINFLIAKLGSDWQPQLFYLRLVIDSIPTSALGSFIPASGGDLVADSVTVTSGERAVMLFSYTDTLGGGITGASLTYTADFGSGSLPEVPGRPGYYVLNVSTSGVTATSHGVHVVAQKAHYATQSKDVSLTVIPPGLPVWLLIGGSLGSASIVVGIFGGYWYLRRARIPFVVKKIDESLKLISKGEHEQAKPVALRSREELIVGITQDRVNIFGRRPIGPEVAEEEAAAGVAPAVATQASALKTELAAVEAKEKPGEAIEEVEMDTLDTELQRLEKFEEKDKLPEGAKEVRDVIEKYKEGKKKK